MLAEARKVARVEAELAEEAQADEPGPAPAQNKKPPLVAWVEDTLARDGLDAVYGDDARMKQIARSSTVDRVRIKELVKMKGGGGSREFEAVLKVYAPPDQDSGGDGQAGGASPYVVQDGQICRMVMTKDGPTPKPLCNYNGHIVEDVVRDDGSVEPARSVLIEGTLDNGQPMPLKRSRGHL